VLVNFAAESFVDNSIENSGIFFNSNVNGVHNLLEHVRMKAKFDRPLFVQISTDEVYGDIAEGVFTENDYLKPSNPYSATKAAAEQFVYAYQRTYGIDYIITRCSNNFGKRQYPEKLIPKVIMSAIHNRPMTIHGDGSYIRSWIHVMDHCEAIYALIEKKAVNDVYNICSGDEVSNLEVVKLIYSRLGVEPKLQFVDNRWGQDLRYAISTERIEKKTGWKSRYKLKETIDDVIKFYKERYGANS
jgi:dTDP-glucose 4,6-dehydratase